MVDLMRFERTTSSLQGTLSPIEIQTQMVRIVGLEPTHLAAEEPKSSESTISTIPADMSGRDTCSYFVVLCFYTARETVAERNA